MDNQLSFNEINILLVIVDRELVTRAKEFYAQKTEADKRIYSIGIAKLGRILAKLQSQKDSL